MENKLYEEYVCPKCFNQLDKCACNTSEKDLIRIDKDIQKHIRILNQKGYKTIFCCSGHAEEYAKYNFTDLYISFLLTSENFITLPEGFYIKKQKNTFKTVMKYRFPKKLSKEEFENMHKKVLDDLLKWCNELP